MWKIGNSIVIPLTLRTQKEFLIESKSNCIFFFFGGGGGFPVTFGLRNFHRGEGAFHSINFVKFCESQSNAVSICTQKEVLIESILKRILGIFVVTLGLRNFHMWGEVKWTFLKNYSIIFCEILWIYPNASDFVHSKGVLDWFKIKWIFRVLLLHLDLEIFIGEVK